MHEPSTCHGTLETADAALADLPPPRPRVRTITVRIGCLSSGPPHSLSLPRLDGVERLLLIDAVELGSVPGENIRLEGSEIPAALGVKISPHQVGVQDLLAAGQLTGREPPHVVLWGMEPGDLEPGTGFSQEVQEALPRLQAEVLDELRRWGVPGRLREDAAPAAVWWETPGFGAMDIGSEGHSGNSSAPRIQRTLLYTREEPWCMSYTGQYKMRP